MKVLDPHNNATRQLLDRAKTHDRWSVDFSRVARPSASSKRCSKSDREAFDEQAAQIQTQLFGWGFETFLTERYPGAKR
jgi:hypothetical protein